MAEQLCASTNVAELKRTEGSPLRNYAAENTTYYTPKQSIPAGTSVIPQNNGRSIPKLFQPLKLRGLELQNRILVSPMCQYSAENGKHTIWHLTHLGGIIQRGPGLTVVEATAVTSHGRITPEDSGLWEDSQIEPFKRLTEFAHSQGQHIAIQLSHAGRKASTVAPWIDRKASAPAEAGGWPDEVLSVSDVPYDEHTCIPKTITQNGIVAIKEAFLAATRRAVTAGFDAIEFHAAHGYLLHTFLSPATNTLSAPYGGSLENRMRLLLEIVAEARVVLPSSMPILVRIPGDDWVAEGWNIGDAVILGMKLAELGVDLLDVSTGGLMATQKVISGPGYQARFSKQVKKAVEGTATIVSVVGIITCGIQAEELLQDGSADVIFVGRPFLKNPGLVWHWAEELGVVIRAAQQIGWGFGQRSGGGIKVSKRDVLFD
ncbi:FMN-linked oxidoreductase [Stipitochalara longipes BDJ]|nr:FMN-linked oxidoreductase [Stipitochalara longipes BDJ]